MSSTALWILIILAVSAAAITGYLVGRQTAPGKRRVDDLQKELEASRQTMADYRKSVDHHFQKTATLFTTMAGSYRELYDHLRESYGTLTDTPGRPLLPEHAGALLEGKRSPTPVNGQPDASPAAPGNETGDATTRPERTSSDDSTSEDMMGDAPNIPEHSDLNEHPEAPVTARKDEEPHGAPPAPAEHDDKTATEGSSGEPGKADADPDANRR
jgi:uncharacterized protein